MRFKNGNEFVSNLVEQYCPPHSVSSTIRLETYYRKAHSMFHHALDVVKQGNDANAYVELMRYANLVVALSTHNSYNAKQYDKDKNLNKRRLKNAITKLEELKPKLVNAYNAEIEKERLRALRGDAATDDEDGDDDEEALNEDEEEQHQEEEQEEEEKKEQSASAVAASSSSPNRWNNLKMESSPYFKKEDAAAGPKAAKHGRKNTLDAIFKKAPSTLTAIYVTDNLVPGFVQFAAENTKRDIETCGVLTGKYLHEEDAYVITHCVIPKQKGSANTVQTLCEEELIGVQEKHGVVTLGWIHSHPSQTCFLSSVDMHCQLSYQIMMPNAVAIVYAPTDKTETFSLTKKGIDVLSKCSCQGFHRHEGVSGLYEKAGHVHSAKRQKCKFIDLRK